MFDHGKTVESILRDLRERAKELDCIYAVEELLIDTDAPVEDIFHGVIKALPRGWQYPEICQARITLGGAVYRTPGFIRTPWMQNAALVVQGDPVGTVEVVYTQEMPAADEGPFLKEERKLIDTVADRLSNWITHRQLMDAMRRWRTAQQALTNRSSSEWQVILELLRRTDHSLLMRIARKMINHLCWSGVKDADVFLRHFGWRGGDGQQEVLMESNQPLDRGGLPALQAMVDRVFEMAAAHLSDDELVACIHKWIKQDRASYLVNSLENYHTSLSEVADALHRYQHATHGEVELTASTLKGLRVSLVRRFLSDQLEYVNVAKNFVDIRDFHELIQRMIYPAKGHGKIGGKSAGLLLASQIVRRSQRENDLLHGLRVPRTWHISSDGLYDFVYCNHLEDVFTQKYKEISEVRQEYPDIVQVFKHSHFSSEVIKGLSVALDDLGDRPLIVRSSSLLEDRFGAAFSGKYKSLFVANQGTKQQRLNALMDAIAEVYASTFSPDPIEYRAERGLLDFQEGMAVMIQEVVGTRVGHYFLPHFAGVAFSRNELRWSPRIRREDGLIRLVPGLGTRAVDRLGDDYPVLVAPGQPGLRVNASVEEAIRYAPRFMDVINLAGRGFETVPVAEFLHRWGGQIPGMERLVSVYQQGMLRQPMFGQLDSAQSDLVVTFEGLFSQTPFIKQIHALLQVLEKKLGWPVDIEFASDGRHLYLLQCRTQNPGKDSGPAPIPRDIPAERVIFSAHRYISNGTVANISHIVYVDPDAYSRLGSLEELTAVGRAVGKLNKMLPKRQFILMGPGRWGSRGDIKLGVRVTYSDINNTAMLIEIARQKGDYTPDLSFGTHFFQDLVESSIRYLPLYPDERGVVFNETFLRHSSNMLCDLLPDYSHLASVIYVLDVSRITHGQLLHVLMNAETNEALGVLFAPHAQIDSMDQLQSAVAPSGEQHWSWRMRMAEAIAAQLDGERFGVTALYIFGSTKNATAGPASDIDLLIHFCGSESQRHDLTGWLEGWSLSLSEQNYLRTGYRTAGLLDVCLITDEDIAQRSSYALKINAATDAARPLPLKKSAPPGT
ncbi:MAG: hypothetical protein HJJLKODD_00598 [Phycisphaerae bacterium]|nr:hypothetical protein [Phycisphaerae bacterium]